MSNALAILSENMASKFELGINSSSEIMGILKQTAFKQKEGAVTDAQMTALLIVAQQYGLNPFTKEIYAYPDKNNGIVPVVGVDGWSRIINNHPQIDGISFNYSDEVTDHKGKVAHRWIECVITRKDRSSPTIVREYFDEVCRTVGYTPWDTHPKRLHRHKALIQCARIAVGFSGIYDEDEAAGFDEKKINPSSSQADKKTETILSGLNKKSTVIDHEPNVTLVEVIDAINSANGRKELDSARELALKLTVQGNIDKAGEAYKARVAHLTELHAKKKVQAEAPVNWEHSIKECGDAASLQQLILEMPDDIQLEYGTMIDEKFDSFRLSFNKAGGRPE